MASTMLRNHVISALGDPDAGEMFEDRMFAFAAEQGIDIQAEDVAGLEDLGEKYVRETLKLFEACLTAAGQAKAMNIFNPVVSACEQFFLKPDARVPDPKGLLGLICHCHAARALLALVSEKTRNIRGFPLLATDPNSEAEVIVSLIGAEQAAILDQIVEAAFAAPTVRYSMNAAYTLSGSLRATGRMSEWGERWEDAARAFGEEIGLRLAADEEDRPRRRDWWDASR